MKKIRYAFEALILQCMLFIFRILDFKNASNLGGLIASKIGQYTRADKTARKNLKRAMPELSDLEIDNIVKQMWDNLGRTAAELSYMAKLSDEQVKQYVTIENHDIFEGAKNYDGAIFFVSAHYGNWELLSRASHAHNMSITSVYRPANNKYTDKIINSIRLKYNRKVVAKGRDGVRNLLVAIKEKQPIGMLVDQKMNDGVAIPFFGIDAMTAPAIAKLALRHQIPIIPLRTIRNNKTNFTMQFCNKINISTTNDRNADEIRILTDINKVFEEWIREHPEQWFWVHNRWPKEN
jgi:KDO2-lipid IV(A) lauroyltransferase